MTNQHNGFTLVELLVTVTIIGILAAMAISQFAAYRKQANDMVALSSVKGLQIAGAAAIVDGIDFNGYIDFDVDRSSNVTGDSRTVDILLPGYQHQTNIKSKIYSRVSTHSYAYFTAGASHCAGSTINLNYGLRTVPYLYLNDSSANAVVSNIVRGSSNFPIGVQSWVDLWSQEVGMSPDGSDCIE